MTFMKAVAAVLLLGAACSAPKQNEPTTGAAPDNTPLESMPAPGDGGGNVPDPPPESTTPADEPGAMRHTRSLDVAQAPRDAGSGGGLRDGGAVRDGGIGGSGDGGVRDGGIGGGGDAGVARDAGIGGGGGGGDAGVPSPLRPR